MSNPGLLFIEYNQETRGKDKVSLRKALSHVAKRGSSRRLKPIPRDRTTFEWTKQISDSIAVGVKASATALQPQQIGRRLLRQSKSQDIESSTESPHSHVDATNAVGTVVSPGAFESGDVTLIPTALDSLRREWFSSFPVLLDDRMYTMLDRSLRTLADSELPFKVIAGSQHPALSSTFNISLQDTALFECNLAASRILEEMDACRSEYRPSVIVIGLHTRALTSVHTRLRSKDAAIDNGLLLCVLLLAAVSNILGDSEAFHAHLKSLRHMIAQRGGLGQSLADRTIRGMLALDDYTILVSRYLDKASDRGTTPGYREPQEILVSPTFGDSSQTVLSLPKGFQAMVQEGLAIHNLIHLISVIARWSVCIGRPRAEWLDQVDAAVLFCDPMETVRDAANILLSSHGQDQQHIIERSFCLAVMMTVRRGRKKNDLSGVHLRLLEDFIHEFGKLRLTGVTANYAIWVAFLVASDTDSPQTEALIDYVLKSLPKAREFEIFDGIMRIFFWYEQLRVDWVRSWQKALGRKSRIHHGLPEDTGFRMLDITSHNTIISQTNMARFWMSK